MRLHFIRYDSERCSEVVQKGSMDFALDVEASFFYPSKERFFREIASVLKRDGTFLYGCFMWRSQQSAIETSLNKYFDIQKSEDISEMALRALELGSPKMSQWIKNEFPRCKNFRF